MPGKEAASGLPARALSGGLALAYGLACYLASLASLAYLVAFVGDLGVPRSVSAGVPGTPAAALGVDLALLALFGLQHSLMARPAFKRVWVRVVPAAAERSTYVLFSSLALGVLFRGWRTLPGTVWDIRPEPARLAVWAVFWAGVVLALASTFLISHLDLFGLRQVWLRFRRLPYREPAFRPTALYARTRHPLMLGFLLTFWSAPTMSASRLLFALGSTCTILAGTWFEERDLLRTFGAGYAHYRRSVPRFFPVPWRRK